MATKNRFFKTAIRTLQGLLIVGLVGINLYLAGGIFNLFETQLETDKIEGPSEPSEPVQPKMVYGYPETDYSFFKEKIKPNTFFATLLEDAGIDRYKAYHITQLCKGVFDTRSLRAGKRYTLVYDNPCAEPVGLVYEPSIYEYFKFDLKNPAVKHIIRPKTSKTETTSGIVRGSLWQSMDAGGKSWELISRMESALGWAVDFYHISNGDMYKLVYERIYVDGKPAGIGKLLGAYYKTKDREYYSLWYENGKYKGYYDLKGFAAKSRFLKAPVKFARISSRYNRHRFHPILKRRRPHLGTDYAAPYGTPILAVADGTVIAATRRGGNGRYVKIKHDKVYQTQYLHMSRFAKGIHRGTYVRQGQVIGYIGSSGLSTGPHVCFRFWKNGRQVNHLKLHFPASKPLPDVEKENFFCASKPVIDMLDAIHFVKDREATLVRNEGT